MYRMVDIFRVYRISNIFRVLEISDIFKWMVDAGPEPTYEEKMRVSPPGYPSKPYEISHSYQMDHSFFRCLGDIFYFYSNKHISKQ